MAVLSDYTSGTISLVNGEVTVTGTGTLFEVTRFQEGDTLQIQNLTAVIASVDSDTQLTLAEPWTGTTIVDGPYRARQLGDGSRVSTQAATVIELLGNGVLTNLAELGVEEGKAPVGGPTGEYELVATSTFGIQDPNGSLGKLAALTLAANKTLNTDASGNLTQSDITASALVLLNLVGSAGTGKFPYFNSASGAAVADIVGTISSGSLMQVGYNNGWYWRFKNGMQITCVTGATTTINSPAGSIFVNGAAIGPYAHPAAFIEEPFCHITSHKFEGVAGHSWATSVSRPSTTQSPSIQLFRATSSTDIFYPVITCFGRFQ